MRTPVLIVAALAAAGCSVSINGGSSMSAATLEDELATAIEERTDQPPSSVECDGALDAEVGATTRCDVTVDDVTAVWRVTAEEVDGSDLDFSWEVQEGTQQLATAGILPIIADGFTAQTGETLTSLECPEETLEATVGVQTTCVGEAASGNSGGITVRVDSVEGMLVDLQWRLEE